MGLRIMTGLAARHEDPDKLAPRRAAQDERGATALYLYLARTLKSPRLRHMLQESASDHAPEAARARRA